MRTSAWFFCRTTLFDPGVPILEAYAWIQKIGSFANEFWRFRTPDVLKASMNRSTPKKEKGFMNGSFHSATRSVSFCHNRKEVI